MESLYILAAAGALMAGLLYGESRSDGRIILYFKTPLSALFILTCVIWRQDQSLYFYLILIGLVFGLMGDVFLALPGVNAFRAGLGAFLLGHVMYVFAFSSLANSVHWPGLSSLAPVGLSVAVFLWLRPHLGKMLIPVILYVFVITAMVIAAWFAFTNPLLPRIGAWYILVGSVAFYMSDIFVARDRFVKKDFLNRYIGLPLYYSGQFLIAFSVGMVG